jgi:Carboxypeptidase regulatory-like domain/TonB-dependent Receptor Plug Domain
MRSIRLAVALLLVSATPLLAQGVPELRGTVRDSTGRAIPRVEVSGGGAKTLSDSIGGFRLAPVPTGRITVRFERDGLLLGEVEANVTSDTTPDADVILLLDKKEPRTMAGIVVDSAGRPVRDAAVEVLSTIFVARTDSMGEFILRDLPERLHIVRTRKVGYNPTYITISLSDSTSTRARIVMRQFAGQNLGLVVVRATRYPTRMRAFLRRAERKSGWGTILTDAQITARHPQNVSDLLNGIPGLTINRDGRSTPTIMGRGGCLMAVFINGFPAPQWGGAALDDMVSSLDIAGVEVYPGMHGVPSDLTNGPTNPCGTIGVWTK